MLEEKTKEIEAKELDQLLYDFLRRIEKRELVLYPIFELLYQKGFRINEVLELNRWRYVENGLFMIETEKGSHKRYMLMNEIPKRFLARIEEMGPGEKYCTYDMIKRRFDEHFQATFCTSENRRLITHLFRHNLAKKLAEQGKEIDVIAHILGEKEEKNALGYVESKIYRTKFCK